MSRSYFINGNSAFRGILFVGAIKRSTTYKTVDGNASYKIRNVDKGERGGGVSADVEDI